MFKFQYLEPIRKLFNGFNLIISIRPLLVFLALAPQASASSDRLGLIKNLCVKTIKEFSDRLLETLSQRLTEKDIVNRSIGLALAYSLFWQILHLILIDSKFEIIWLLPQIFSSFLIFFTFNGLFASFFYYRKGWIFQILTSTLYIHPFFQLMYYYTYKSFLEQQNLSLIIREPFFLIKVFAMEMTLSRFLVLFSGAVIFFLINFVVLNRKNLFDKKIKPYDFFLNKWVILFNIWMIIMQILWCLDHDKSQLIMRPFYPITLIALTSVLVFLMRNQKQVFVRTMVFALILMNSVQLYALNLGLFNIRDKLTLDSRYYRSLFGAFYVQTVFGSMEQNEEAHERFSNLPNADIDYNILIVINDAQRWDYQSSNGYPQATDKDLNWFLQKSFNFQFPISPANFTDTSMPAILSGLASDQDVRKIKGSLAVWDYFAKTTNTFFVSSQDITWSKLNLFYASIGQKHVWSATAQPGYKGNPEDTIDRLSLDYLKSYIPTLKGPFVGVWQTFASHAPYTTEPEFQIYKPCHINRDKGIEIFRNCYLNAQVYSAHIRSELFKTLDLENTVIVMSSDHGEGLGEHGVFYHGVDYHQEMVKVPFNLYIPERLQKKIAPQKLENLKSNLHKVVSITDITPTLVHMHELVTGQKLYESLDYYTGKSLFEKWDHRVVFSSHCFPQYRCYSREIMFADDNYYVLFRPSEGFYKIYETWKDLDQTKPLTIKDVDPVKFEALIEEAARVHSAGQSMKSYYDQLKAHTK